MIIFHHLCLRPERTRVLKTLNVVDRVYGEFTRRIATPDLNQFLEEARSPSQPPAAVKGRWVRLFYMTQPQKRAPNVYYFQQLPEIDSGIISAGTCRIVLRERFGFDGVPFTIKLKPRERNHHSQRKPIKATRRWPLSSKVSQLAHVLV